MRTAVSFFSVTAGRHVRGNRLTIGNHTLNRRRLDIALTELRDARLAHTSVFVRVDDMDDECAFLDVLDTRAADTDRTAGVAAVTADTDSEAEGVVLELLGAGGFVLDPQVWVVPAGAST